MRRLYLQIYLTFVGILILFSVIASITWFLIPHSEEERQAFKSAEMVLGQLLPGPDRPVEKLQEVLDRFGDEFPVHLTVRGPDGALLAVAGEPLPAPGRTESGWMRSHGHGPTVAVRLPGDRWLVARHMHQVGGFAGGWLGIIALLGAAIAIGAYPVVRRITSRLERLQIRVDELGEGDLSARVKVEGSDEVAKLARSFNRAADRIERLVKAQQNALASASHELRSPLARMRVAIELLGGDERPELRQQVSRDIGELDELIGELLLASRLNALDQLEGAEEVDLLALLAEEGARSEAEVSGEPVRIQGDPRMLRRLIRNLLENAHRYGAGSRIEARAAPLGRQGALLRVADRGPGVAEEERERIFEPFYRPAGMHEPAEGGAGLGLALVRQIARHHRGDARCLPRPGGGTCFEVELNSE